MGYSIWINICCKKMCEEDKLMRSFEFEVRINIKKKKQRNQNKLDLGFK